MSAPPLAMTGVGRRYGAQPVLDDIELVLEEGSSTWIGGRNGAGKTTLLRIAAGLIAADAGTVTVRGCDVRTDRRRYQTHVGFLSAGNTGLYARLRVRAHLDYWAALAFIPRAERAPAVARALADFGLADLGGRRLDRLSMGQRQRVRMAMAFMHEPDLVLLDEPRTSLDEEGTALLAATVARVVGRGGTVLTCAPTTADAGIAFDRRLVIDAGRLHEA